MEKTSSHNDVSTALSYESNESSMHVSLVPLGMKVAHDPTEDDLWGEVEVPRASEVREVNDILKHDKVFEITL